MLRFDTLDQMLTVTAQKQPQHLAVVEDQRALTYEELDRVTTRIAANLRRLGVSKGDRVALLLPNALEFATCYFGILKAGGIVVTLNYRLKASELEYILKDAAPKVLVYDEGHRETVEILRGSVPSVRHYFMIEPFPDLPAGTRPYTELEQEGADPFSDPSINASDDIAQLTYTSGTTGLPKGAAMSHKNLLVNAENCRLCLDYQGTDRTLISVPLFHVTGLNSQLIALMYVGGTSFLQRFYKTAATIDLLERHKITIFFAAPTIFIALLASPALEGRNLSSLRILAYGGGPISPRTIEDLAAKFPWARLHNTYGLTEVSSLATVHPYQEASRRPESVGRGVPSVSLRVVDGAGRDLPPGEVGELLIKGPNVVAGYWNKPEATREAIVDGWLHTGDMVKMDEEGFVYIMDRKKDMIVRGAENIYSKEVEDVIYRHPAVLEAAVFPVVDDFWGEVPHAAVVLRPGASLGAEELRRFCAEQLADYKVPVAVHFMEELPKNPSGKIRKNVLSQQFGPAQGSGARQGA